MDKLTHAVAAPGVVYGGATADRCCISGDIQIVGPIEHLDRAFRCHNIVGDFQIFAKIAHF